ncbi:hypothetical protein SAMN04515648_0696 [Phyllobacterium sp. CL33Tsu]|uniref:hypothetical protein n=1 Tax=Phyllobacterium sp. CL33Tsu TaxID=1798191 RepID=UPI0008EBD81C|nr:hypothetical protein [Phyllobacterium sp. CL33Tsu]SFI59851.1 hypothetical protein SAMN04515648_0696 [Phyllobacterium sp. CL33Tsu]
MRAALSVIALGLLVVAGCTTGMKGGSTAASGPSPAKDTYYVPPPKSLTTRASPSKEPSVADAAKPAKPAAPQ